jgi:hypothetical protein
VPASGLAFRFTIPPLHIDHSHCEIHVYADRSNPATVSLLNPKGAVLATESSCWEGNPNSSDCLEQLMCSQWTSTSNGTPLVLLIEPRHGATTVSAGVSVFERGER